MAFSDFKNIAQVQQTFGIVYREENFIVPQSVAPPAACGTRNFTARDG